MSRMSRIAVIVLIVAFLLGAFGTFVSAAPETAPLPYASWTVKTIYPQTILTTTVTRYSECATGRASADLCTSGRYTQADIFLTVNFSTTGAITFTPQYSADSVNWSSSIEVAEIISASADGTSYVVIAPMGGYLRFAVDSTATASQTITATVKVVYKNP